MVFGHFFLPALVRPSDGGILRGMMHMYFIGLVAWIIKKYQLKQRESS